MPRTLLTRRLTAAAFGALTVALVGVAPAASADPPPNCTAADLEGVRTGVQFATSAYLFTHPDVNAFFSSLGGLPRAEVLARVKTYMADNPQVQIDIAGIRQPMLDIKTRCGDVGEPGPF